MTWTTTIGDWIEEAKLSVEGHDVAVYENIVAVAEDGIYHSYLGVVLRNHGGGDPSGDSSALKLGAQVLHVDGCHSPSNPCTQTRY